jgi:hypothetical protein
MSHTPGPWTSERIQAEFDAPPWEWHPTGSGDGYVIMKGQQYMAETYTMRHACLLAAAPELLEAAKVALVALTGEGLNDGESAIEQLEYAITHAQGKG